MSVQERWYAGVDWASESHHVWLTDSQGSRIGEKIFKHAGEGLAEMVTWLLAASGAVEPGQINIAIEVPHGPVVETLIERGFAVYALNPKQMDRFRDRYSPAGAKDDSRDALVMASALRTDPHCFRELAATDPTIVELREWSRIAEDLTAERTGLTNRMRQQLWRYFPAFLDLDADLAAPWLLELWQAVPTPDKARRSRPSSIATILKRNRIRRLGAAQVLDILRKPPLTVAAGTTEAARAHIVTLVARIGLINRQIAHAHHQLDALTARLGTAEEAEPGQPKQRDAEILASLPGIGRIVLATLLAEATDALQRRDYPALRCLTGVAPVTKKSGRSRIVLRRHACHRRLANAVYHWARTATQHDSTSRAKYAALRARGHSHGRALRSVADRLLNVACSMLRTGTPFNPSPNRTMPLDNGWGVLPRDGGGRVHIQHLQTRRGHLRRVALQWRQARQTTGRRLGGEMSSGPDGREPGPAWLSPTMGRRTFVAAAGAGLLTGAPRLATAAPADQLTWGIHVSLAPTWFEPAEASGIITPFMVLYALHDAMVKPMPGNVMAPSLAQSVTASADGRTYDFAIRDGATFHNGEPVTSADVKFSFERYRGVAHDLLQSRVAAVETPDVRLVRFRLKEPWPDFQTFYATATGAGWVVPKSYVEKVGDEGFKKAPIGAGPYKFVSFTPGVELVLEAYDRYWRKKPAVKRLVFKVIPEEGTRLAALKLGEIDIAYSVRGELAEQLRKTPGLELKPAVIQAPFCLYFPDQWDAKSPWHDVRVRKAASLALDCKGINDALTLGYSEVTGNSIVPKGFDFYWQPPLPEFDPDRARKLLAEAGFRSGFDAGNYYCDTSYANIGEVAVDNLLAVGIRTKLRPIERAAFIKEFSEKKYKNIIQAGPGAFGNAATRIEAHLVKGGVFSYGSYPDIDELYRQQAGELDRARREAMLFKIQQLMVERTIYAPIWQLAFINGIGPRVGESGFGRIPLFPYTAPYEDITMKAA